MNAEAHHSAEQRLYWDFDIFGQMRPAYDPVILRYFERCLEAARELAGPFPQEPARPKYKPGHKRAGDGYIACDRPGCCLPMEPAPGSPEVCDCPSRARFIPRDDGTCPNCFKPFPKEPGSPGAVAHSLPPEPRVAADSWTDRWGRGRLVIAGSVPHLYGGSQTLDEKALAGRVLELREQRDELADVLEAILPRLSYADWPESLLNSAWAALRKAGRS